jgi:DNA topoisomerase-1
MALLDALVAADEAGLYYVNDARPGITRRRRGSGWSYRRPDGKAVDASDRAWIEAIVIPPAWTDVWISPVPDGHILATGRDQRGRKQYRYHPRWREVRDGNKYHRMSEFALALPTLRQRIERDLRRRGLPRNKVLGAVVRLLDDTLIRIGNAEYAADNESYGLTTLQDDHATVTGRTVEFEFRGKSGKEQDIVLRDRRLASIVKACQDLPGEELFQYLDDDGRVVDVSSGDVNEYLRTLTGDTFTAKDFRTWGGSVTAAEALADMGPAATATEAKRNVVAAIDAAATALGNTRTVARNCYVHPRVTESYEDGSLHDAFAKAKEKPRFSAGEDAVLRLLRRPPVQ